MGHQNLMFLRLLMTFYDTSWRLNNHRLTAIGVSETWLNETTSDLVEISGYNYISNHSINKSEGGVGLYLLVNFEYEIAPSSLNFEGEAFLRREYC